MYTTIFFATLVINSLKYFKNTSLHPASLLKGHNTAQSKEIIIKELSGVTPLPFLTLPDASDQNSSRKRTHLKRTKAF